MSMPPGYEVDWNLVRTFVSVVEAGSLAAAARSLKLAHPTVARHIQQLEAQLGVALFERATGGLTLNESGQRLAEVAERMRREAMTLESVGEAVRSDTSGRIRITIAEFLADLVPGLLGPLQEAPGSAERLIELIVSRQQLNLLDREADIAVRHIRPHQGELVCRRVGNLPMGAWASTEYLARHGHPGRRKLAGHRFIDGLSTRGFTLALERLGYRIETAQVGFRTDSLQSQLRAAALGWGIVGIPDYMADQTQGLERVLVDAPEAVSLEIWLVARPAVRHQQLLRMAFDTLADGLGERFQTGEAALPQGVPAGARDASLLSA